MTPAARIAAFRKLHEAGCFVIPNPWDIGSARWLAGAGFKALATTSSGFAFTLGRADGDVGLEAMLAHLAEMAAATPDLPINADFENGYADAPEEVARNALRCAATGVAGLSIEDSTGRAEAPLYDFDLALARVKAARAALDREGSGVMLTARAEGALLLGEAGFPEALRRIAAFAGAGADVLYAPGIKSREHIGAVVKAAGGRPVNVLAWRADCLPVAEIAGLGARRVSIGGALARAAWAAFIRATRAIVEGGAFTGFAGNDDSAPLNPFFRKDRQARGG